MMQDSATAAGMGAPRHTNGEPSLPVTKEQVLQQLKTVNDPELHRDIVTLNMVEHVAVCEGVVNVKVKLTTPACPLKDQIEKEVRAAVRRVDGVQEVNVEFSAEVAQSPQQRAAANNALP